MLHYRPKISESQHDCTLEQCFTDRGLFKDRGLFQKLIVHINTFTEHSIPNNVFTFNSGAWIA